MQPRIIRRRPDPLTLAVGALMLLIGGCSSSSRDAATPSSSGLTSTTSTTATILATTTSSSASPPAPSARITENLDAADLAAALSNVELTAAQGDGSVGPHQQLLYRYLSAHPELDDSVLAGVADGVRPFVERIVRARQFGQARQAANPSPPPPSDTLPAWKVVEPPSVNELLGDYHAAEAATGIAWYWLAAIHLQETRMGRIIGTSSAGAVGPMQFLPATWTQCCSGDPTVARDAIIGAAVYLAQHGGPSNMQSALHAYNPSDTYVATVTAFAENMRDNPLLYDAYHEWQVFYSSSAGVVRLPIGYHQQRPIDAATYLVDHPDDAAG